MTDYESIADEAVDLLLRIGSLGLDESHKDEVWDLALGLKARLEPNGSAAQFLGRYGSVKNWRKRACRA